MHWISLAALLLVSCGPIASPGLADSRSVSTRRVYEIPHGADSQVGAFDQMEEWVAINWNSPKSVVHLSKERTKTLVVKWIALSQGVSVDVTGVFKVDDTAATLTFISTIPVESMDAIYGRWDTLALSTPWGKPTIVDHGASVPAAPTGPRCRSDRDCDRGSACNAGRCRRA